MLDHYLVLTARPGQEQTLSAVLDRFARGIKGQLDSLLDISAGPNVNQGGLDRGYTHGCYVRLTDRESLMTSYWNHPAHQALLAEIDAVCADRFVVDVVREA